jgi:oligopeptidase A
MQTQTAVSSNPLLDLSGLPRFGEIQPSHIAPAIEQVLADNRAELARLIETAKPYTWDSLIAPVEDLNDRLDRAWAPVSHLHSVADNDALREAYNHCIPLISAYRSELGQNRGLHDAYRAVFESAEFSQLEPGQQQTIRNELRDFHLSGIDLPADKQARLKDISQELSRLTTKFGENVLDATREWKKQVTDESLLAGLPDSVKAMARLNAEREQLDGWVLTLDAPCLLPTMNYAENRALREEMYIANVTRASDQGPDAGRWDNSQIMQDILRLRHEKAQLLGFANYAEYSLATKMAEKPQDVVDFLYDLARRARPAALKELEEVRQLARRLDGLEEVQHWDVPYYSEKLRLEKYDLSQETLRPWFPLPRVLEGLFRVVHRLYGLSVEPRDDVTTWHPDAHFYDVYDSAGQLRGQFYFDPYARPGKRGGAWIADAITRKRGPAGVQTPVAYVNCNFSPASADQPALLTHNEVITLFHEFGHALHHMLTLVDYLSVSGIRGVPWDAVELPSQFMENWAWQHEALDLLARHWQTGEPLPEDLYRKMQAAKNFQAGLFTVRQLEFALFDFRLHLQYQPGQSGQIQSLLDEVRGQVAAIIPPAFNRFQHGFSHVFAGGYAAGYYSYKWAEVLSADAFSKFEETGIFDPHAGRGFLHNILEQGGSRDIMELYQAFRGRKPTIDALLRQSGMAEVKIAA